MVTSVGHDAATACASIRAGLQRPAQLAYYSVLDEDDQAQKPLVGRPLQGLTDGFFGVGRWLRLASLALHDLRRRAAIPGPSDAGFWSATAIFVVAPENDAQRFWLDDGVAVASLESMLGALLDREGWPVAPTRRVILRDGHAGFARAVEGALAPLRARAVERVIVLSADSCVDANTVAWLDENERLKTESNPFGVIPGEAAACVMLTSASEGNEARGPAPRVHAARFNPGVVDFRSGEPMLGRATAHALAAALETAKRPALDGIVFADLNGEPWRAQELGSARMRLRAQLSDEIDWVLPAESLGEVGAASGGVALCLAASELKRQASTVSRAAVLSLSESGASGCILLHAPGA